MDEDYTDQLYKIMVGKASLTLSIVAAVLIHKDGSKRVVTAKIGSSTGYSELQVKSLVNDCRKMIGPDERLEVVRFNGITIPDLESVATSILLLTKD